MFRSASNALCLVGALLCLGSGLAQPITLMPQDASHDPLPLGLAMYNVFSTAALSDSEEPGSGVAYVQNVVDIKNEARAEAVFEYMRTAFYAGRHSSEARTREFCARNINTATDFIRELELRRTAHEAELSRLSLGIERVVTSEEFHKLRRTAEAVASGSMRKKIDYASIYARGAVDVTAELARRCQPNP